MSETTKNIAIILILVIPILIVVFSFFAIEFYKPSDATLLPYKTFIKLYNALGKCDEVDIGYWVWNCQTGGGKYNTVNFSPITHIGRYKFSRIVKKQQKDYVRQMREDSDVLALEQITKMLNREIKNCTTSVQQECKNIRNILNVH